MALKARQRGFSIDLSASVSSALNSIQAIRSSAQAVKNVEFQKAVAAGMSYNAQVGLLQKMIKDEKASPFSDSDFIGSLEVSLGNSQKMARYETIRNKYNVALDDYVQNKGSLDSYIKVLQDGIANTTDDNLKEELHGKLSQAFQDQAQNHINAIQNRATLATKDRSQSELDKSISEIKDRKAAAAVNGNEDEVSQWDQTLQALTSTKSNIQIQNGMNDLTLKINKDNPKAGDKLGYYKAQIASADATTPVIFNGVEYGSMKEFWSTQQDSYIAGNNPQTGSFFQDKQSEDDKQTAKIAATSKYGIVPTARIQLVSQGYDDLKTRPEFANYLDLIDQQKVATTVDMTTKVASALNDEFQGKVSSGEITDQTYNSELDKLEGTFTHLESTFGVNLQRQATAKEAAAGGIIADVNTGIKNLPVTPVESANSAANQAEIARAKDVWANADKLAGTGKYAGMTAQQVRDGAHNYVNDINSGKINNQGSPSAAAPATPNATGNAGQPTAQSSAQELAQFASSHGVTSLQTQDWWVNNPNKQEAWNIMQKQAVPQTVPATQPKPPVTPPVAAPAVKPVAAPQPAQPKVVATPAAPATTGGSVMYNGRSYKDQAAADKAKARDTAMGKSV